ncbi:unnamed protein product [Brassica oleracea var. botrytis]
MLFISLSSNGLTGKIPVGFGNLERLAILQLGNNSLTGNVPPELGNCKSLVWLDLNRNHLTGNLPAELASQAGLVMPVRVSVKQLLYIRNEDGRGCRGAGGLFALEVVLVKRLRDSPMVQSCPKDRIYPVRYIFSSNGSMVYFDLSYNSVSGSIPLSYGDMEYLQILNLGHSLLSGTIPDSFWGLKEIGVLDSGITWRPLFPHRLGRSHAHPKEQGIETGMIAGFVFSFMCVLILTVARYRVRKVKKKEKKRDKYIECLPTSGSSNNWKLSTASEPLSINVATFEKPLTYVDLLVATNGFGDVYKAQLADGSVVAVKKLNQFTGQGDRELMAEMETIGKIKYRNLVPLLDYCKIGEERLLVYEYMRHGSLETVLHRGEIFLDWTARKKIATGAARGLAFLHHSCIPHIIHRNMKSSNVLLDQDLIARVSDFGMVGLVSALDTRLGYVPPEYHYQSFQCTTEGDVYSYGVILLELLSGKRPIDPEEFGEDNNLVGWAKQLYRESRRAEIFDPNLITEKSDDVELFHYLRIASLCLDERPFERPTMIQVMTMLKELVQVDTENNSLDEFSLKETPMVEEESRGTEREIVELHSTL